jgi:hypothetical protein
MNDIPPEVAQQLGASVPLFAFGLALYLASILLVVAALLSLLPAVYQDRPNRAALKWKMFGVLVAASLVAAGFGYFTITELSTHILDMTEVMSNIQEIPDPSK